MAIIVHDFNDIVRTRRNHVVSDAQWSSVRMLLADDGLGYSLHVTLLDGGSEHIFEYKHHLKCVCGTQGAGSITDVTSRETHDLRPGVM